MCVFVCECVHLCACLYAIHMFPPMLHVQAWDPQIETKSMTGMYNVGSLDQKEKRCPQNRPDDGSIKL